MVSAVKRLRPSLKLSTRGFTFVELIVVMGITAVVTGLVIVGATMVRASAAEVVAVNRAEHIGHALQMYFNDNKEYPDSYPAELEDQLEPYLNEELRDYIRDPRGFENPGLRGQGATPLNKSYVEPPAKFDANRYVLKIDPDHARARSAVLLGDQVVRLAERLTVQYGSESLYAGDVVSGGTINFSTGTTVELDPNTTARMIFSFKLDDGSSYHVVKVPRYRIGALRADVVSGDHVQVVTGSGVAFINHGVVDIEIVPRETPGGPEDAGDDPVGMPWDSGDYAVFSKTGLQFNGNMSVDQLVGSNGNVVFSGNSSTRSVKGGGSLITTSNLDIAGDVIMNGSVSLSSQTHVTGAVHSGGSVSLNSNARVASIVCDGSITLNSNGRVDGNAESGGNFAAGSNGVVYGNVAADGNITLSSNGKIWGTGEYAGTFTGNPSKVVGGLTEVGYVEVNPLRYTPIELPPPSEYIAGSENISVSSNNSRILAPGAYGTVSLAGNSKLYLSTGTYIFSSFSASGNFDLYLSGTGIEIFVVGNVTGSGNADVHLENGATASDIYLETHGNFSISGNAQWKGAVFAPNGTFYMGGNSCLQGSCFVDGVVTVGGNGSIIFSRSVRQIGGDIIIEEEEDPVEVVDDGPILTNVKITNYSAAVSADAKAIGSGDGAALIPARNGLTTTTRLGDGLLVPRGEWRLIMSRRDANAELVEEPEVPEEPEEPEE